MVSYIMRTRYRGEGEGYHPPSSAIIRGLGYYDWRYPLYGPLAAGLSLFSIYVLYQNPARGGAGG